MSDPGANHTVAKRRKVEQEQDVDIVVKKVESASSTAKKQDLDLTFDVLLPLMFTALGLFTRLWRIGVSNIVTWDEAHFGKFGSHYIKREFYFDVHPPLGKMLVGLSGYLAGYNGSFPFTSGERYPEEVNYVFMRMFNAMFGALTIPIAWYTAKTLKFSKEATILVTVMVLCENSMATISRFILLDSMLLFFTTTSMLCLAKIHSLRYQNFTPEWWLWMSLAGISLGCVGSVKWVGFFSVVLVGVYTIEDLWNKFGDLSIPKQVYFYHWIARVVTLIFLPVAVYMLNFYIHFTILCNSGPGDAQMSSLFQANLRGSDLPESPLEIAIGSRVTIKNAGYGGGLLHSHVQTFPEGSQQQQVTCYHHKDSNNEWHLYPTREEPEYVSDQEVNLRYVADGSTVRLIHTQTGRNLHSHFVSAPITKSANEVSCYGNLTIGDEKDYWTFEVVDDVFRSRDKIRTLTTTFRLKHKVLGCYLRAANVNLPQWGFKQIEVTCARDSNPKDTHTHWNIERHWNDKLPAGDIKAYRSPFLKDFIHLNVAMKTSNDALVPDPDKIDELSSQAWQWPILHVGLRMCSWSLDTIKYYLLGNPMVVWGSSLAIVLVVIITPIYVARWQRHYKDFTPSEIDHFRYSGLYPFLGYIFHYLPFHIVGRVLYVHHFIPVLYFGILVTGFVADFLTRNISQKYRRPIYGLLCLIVIGTFIIFKDITFGMEGRSSQWKHLKWLSTWNLYDEDPIVTPMESSAATIIKGVERAVSVDGVESA